MIRLCLTCVETVKEIPKTGLSCGKIAAGIKNTRNRYHFGIHSGYSPYSHTPGSRPITSIPTNTRSPFFMIKFKITIPAAA